MGKLSGFIGSFLGSYLITFSREKKKFVKRSNKHPDRCPFNPQMVELMAESRVFIYPELLPKIAVFQVEQG